MKLNGISRRLTRFIRRHSATAPSAIFVLFVICLPIQWLQNKSLSDKKRQVSEALTIYHQMRVYSQSACNVKAAEENLVFRGRTVAVDSETVKNDVTFIFISKPDLACANSRLIELRKKYPLVKIVVAFENREIMSKQTNEASFTKLQDVINLGGFQNYPDALQNAILVVETRYFMVLHSQLAIGELQHKFVEKLLANIPGFEVLGGSEINVENEFFMPCHRLRLRNWTFFENFEYNVNGNALQCESISPHFLAKTDAFKKIMELKGFDSSMGEMWRQDFFVRAKGLLVVGILPEVVFKSTSTSTCPELKTSEFKDKKRIDTLLPFVDKYHVLSFVDQNGRQTTICDGSDPLICSEKYIFPKWKLRHWAYSGLTAFPFVIERLRDALHFGTAQLEKAGIKYILEGGTLLGFVKVRQILPWDSGDVDTFVFTNRRQVINLVKKIKQFKGYEYKLRWNAFHVYVTPYYPTHDGLIVYAVNRSPPDELVKVRMHGRLFPTPRSMFKFIREHYGSSYLESRIRFGDERVSCDYEGYQACMPDCRWDGCGSGRGQFPGIL